MHSTIISHQGELDENYLNKKKQEIICENNACGVCQLCQKINENTYADIIQVDSDVKKDDIDTIIQRFSQRGIEERGIKILVIKNIHNLSKVVINSILKFVEEPPANTNFIMTTTNTSAVIETLKSRSHILNINFEDNTDDVEAIKSILNSEINSLLSAHKDLKEYPVADIKKSVLRNISKSNLNKKQKELVVDLVSKCSKNINKNLFIDALLALVTEV